MVNELDLYFWANKLVIEKVGIRCLDRTVSAFAPIGAVFRRHDPADPLQDIFLSSFSVDVQLVSIY